MITFFNGGAEKIFGYRADEIIGKPLDTLIPERFRRAHAKNMDDFARSPVSSRYMNERERFFAIRKDGTEFPAEASISKLGSGDGTIFTAILRDVTAQEAQVAEALRQSEERDRILFDQSPVGVYIFDKELKVTRCNKRMVEILQSSYDNVIGYNIRDLNDKSFVLATEKTLEGLSSYQEGLYQATTSQAKAWLLQYFSPLYDAGGNVIGGMGVAEDITERKRAEEALLQTQKGLSEAQRIARLGNWDWDIRTNKLSWSDEIYRIFGLMPPEFGATYDAFLGSVHPEDREFVKKSVNEALYEGKNYDIDHRILLPDGSVRMVHEQAEVTFDDKGKPVRMIGTVQDITERKHVEDALREKTGQLQTITDAMTAFLTTGNWREASAVLLRSAISQTASEYGFIGVVVEGPTLRILNHEGIVWDNSVNREFYDNVMRTYEERGYLEFANFNNLFGTVITTGKPVVSNDCAADSRSGGIPPGHPPLNHFLGVPILRGAEVVGMIGVANRRGGYTAIERNKIEILMQQAAGVLYDNYRRQQREAALEIERKQTEEALRENERMLSTLLSNLPGFSYRCVNDKDWTMEFMSEGVLKLTGYTVDEYLLYRTVTYGEIIHPEDRDRVWGEVQTALERRQPFELVYRIITKSGDEKWAWERGRGLYSSDGDLLYVEGFITDITERKLLEEELRQAQKMEAVGRLAGGVAHDFNNLLTVIINYSDLMLLHPNIDDRLQEDILEIKRAGERASALTSQLLAFSRRQVLQPKVHDLNAVVADMKNMLGRLLPEHIELITDLEPELRRVKADPGQIEQVIMNLAVNAGDSMPKGGKLIIETANVDGGKASSDRHPEVQNGHYVMVAVSDMGHGMDEETMSHVFEPFYTTKELSKGTGLGLATTYGIVKQSGGHISVNSEIDGGTTFVIYLPCIEEDAERIGGDAVAGRRSPGGKETILIAEDEGSVRVLVSKVLRDKGYRVLEAGNSDEAFQVCDRYDGPIDLLVTDVVMPKVSGPELAGRLAELYPDMKVLYISGYTNNAIALKEEAAFLGKPFTHAALLSKVREVLDTPRK